jgi:hypothetical protein
LLETGKNPFRRDRSTSIRMTTRWSSGTIRSYGKNTDY